MARLATLSSGIAGAGATGSVAVARQDADLAAGFGVTTGIAALAGGAALSYADGPSAVEDAFFGYGSGALASGILLGFTDLIMGQTEAEFIPGR